MNTIKNILNVSPLSVKQYFDNQAEYLGEKGPTIDLPNEDVRKLGEFAGLSYEKDPPKELEGFGELQPMLSSDDYLTYIDPEKKKVNISIRGTDLLDKERRKRDIPSDISILFRGQQDGGRYFDTKKNIERIKRTYPEHEITTYGFSLGGSIGRQISRENPEIKSTSFNPASGLNEIFQDAPKYAKVYRVKGDILSRGVKGPSEMYDPTVLPYYSHALGNITL